MQAVKRVSTPVFTRKLARLVAHNNMRKEGCTKVNKKEYHTVYSITGNLVTINDGSFFSRNWRKYVNAV